MDPLEFPGILSNILSFLSIQELTWVRQVSRFWNHEAVPHLRRQVLKTLSPNQFHYMDTCHTHTHEHFTLAFTSPLTEACSTSMSNFFQRHKNTVKSLHFRNDHHTTDQWFHARDQPACQLLRNLLSPLANLHTLSLFLRIDRMDKNVGQEFFPGNSLKLYSLKKLELNFQLSFACSLTLVNSPLLEQWIKQVLLIGPNIRALKLGSFFRSLLQLLCIRPLATDGRLFPELEQIEMIGMTRDCLDLFVGVDIPFKTIGFGEVHWDDLKRAEEILKKHERSLECFKIVPILNGEPSGFVMPRLPQLTRLIVNYSDYYFYHRPFGPRSDHLGNFVFDTDLRNLESMGVSRLLSDTNLLKEKLPRLQALGLTYSGGYKREIYDAIIPQMGEVIQQIWDLEVDYPRDKNDYNEYEDNIPQSEQSQDYLHWTSTLAQRFPNVNNFRLRNTRHFL